MLQKIHLGCYILLGTFFLQSSFSYTGKEVDSLLTLCIKTLHHELTGNVDNYSQEDIDEISTHLSGIKKDKELVKKILYEKNKLGSSLVNLIQKNAPIKTTKLKGPFDLMTCDLDSKKVATSRFSYFFDATFEVTCHQTVKITVFDIQTGKKIRNFKMFGCHPTAMIFTPSGEEIVSAYSNKNCVAFCNLKTKKTRIVNGFNILRPDIFDNNGKQVVLVQGAIAKIIDTKRLVCKKELKGHVSSINKAFFSPNNKYIAAVLDNCTVWIWDVQKEKHIQTLSRYKVPILYIQFSPNSELIMTGGESRKLCIWDAKKGTCIRDTYKWFWIFPRFSMNSENVIIDSGNFLEVRNIKSNTNKLLLYGVNNQTPKRLSPNEKYMLLPVEGKCTSWNLFFKSKKIKLISYRNFLEKINFSPNSRYVIACTNDYAKSTTNGIIHIHDLLCLDNDEYFDSLSLNQVFALYKLCAGCGKIKKNEKKIFKTVPEHIQVSVKAIRKNKKLKP